MTGAPLIDITHLRRVSGGPASQRQILEGIRWIPSDTSGGVLERGNSLQVISARGTLEVVEPTDSDGVQHKSTATTTPLNGLRAPHRVASGRSKWSHS